MLPHRSTLSKLQPQHFGALASHTKMATRATQHTKRFAPLDPTRSSESDAPRLKGIVFDVDGTLWYVLDFILFQFILSRGFGGANLCLIVSVEVSQLSRLNSFQPFLLILQNNVMALRIPPMISLFIAHLSSISRIIPNAPTSILANPNHTCSNK